MKLNGDEHFKTLKRFALRTKTQPSVTPLHLEGQRIQRVARNVLSKRDILLSRNFLNAQCIPVRCRSSDRLSNSLQMEEDEKVASLYLLKPHAGETILLQY